MLCDMRILRTLSLLALCWLAACTNTDTACEAPPPHGEPAPASNSPSSAEDPAPSTWRELTTAGETFRISWMPQPDPIPLNDAFEMLVQIHDQQGQPVEGAIVVVNGTMPGHGHGMLRVPQSEDTGSGTYRVRGMLLHMAGHWEMRIDAVVGGAAHSSSFDLYLD
ncbi:MAG: hypothetical protein ACI841_005256 [Planctomycetota bacterium]|jgi:hypothetical protein